MGSKARGIWRIVQRAEAPFLPKVPFAEGGHHKGRWEPFSRAPAHAWRHYDVPGDVAEPVSCVVLSDLHAGSHAGDIERFEAIAQELLARRFDMLLLAGDFVNMQIFGGGRIRPETLAEILSPVTRTVPSVAVLGNHDADYGNARVAGALEGHGVAVLANRTICVETRGGPIHVAGLEDHSSGMPDAAMALGGLPDGAAVLVLAHDPASFAQVPDGPIATISGHTHGGQFRLPWIGAVVNASEAPLGWTHGHIVESGRNLIVSAGLGTSGLPWRINCPPEIVEITIIPSGRAR